MSGAILRDEHGALRPGWRILLYWGFVAAVLLLWNVAVRVAAAAGGTTTEALLPSGSLTRMLVGSVVMAVAALAGARASIRWIERAGVRDFLGWRWDARGLGVFGRFFVLGAVFVSAVVLGLVLTGSVSCEVRRPDLARFAPLALVFGVGFLIASLAEEVFDRGYVFRVLAARRPWLAVLLTSILFALGHAFEAWSAPLALANVFLVGCVLGVIYLRTGNLWAIWGFHFGVNVFEAVVFQFPVRGYEILADHLFTWRLAVSELITGGAAGLQGGVVYSAVGLALLFLVARPGRNLLFGLSYSYYRVVPDPRPHSGVDRDALRP